MDDYDKIRMYISNKRRRIETATSNANKACIYWREKDAVKYGEWVIIEMVGKRLLEKCNSTEKQGRENSHIDLPVIDVDDTEALKK